NGFMPPDGGHAALVEIPKRLWLFAADHSQNIASCLTPLLHRYGGDSRQRLSRLMRKVCKIADHLHFRMSRNCEVVIHNNSANTVNRCDKRFPDERRIVAGRPNLHATWDEFTIQFYAGFCNVRYSCARAHIHTQLDQLLSRALGQIRWVRGE